MRFLKILFGALLLGLIAVAAWLYFAPPDLIRVGANYTAKMVCSNVFVAGRDADEVLKVDVQAPGHPLLRIMQVEVDRENAEVRAGLFGFIGNGIATYKHGMGCTARPNGNVPERRPSELVSAKAITIDDWPNGTPPVVVKPDGKLAGVLGDLALTGEGMRAVVVIKNGQLIGETYAEGFMPTTPLLGWSMTKTITGALVGTLVKSGQLSLDQKNLLPEWVDDARSEIRLRDLLGMASDLTWDEDYGSVTDVTRMLFLQPDMEHFVSAKPLDLVSPEGAGEIFEYSSGTSVIVSRIWQNAVGADALSYPAKALFEPLGMTSAVFETDASGTFVGSSYLYAEARDWARFGQFLLQDGKWNGQELLPKGFVEWMKTPHSASNGKYGQGHLWRRAPRTDQPGENPDLPKDAFWLAGHDGQSVAIVPSADLVVVRLGLTPSKLNYKPAFLLKAVLEAVQ